VLEKTVETPDSAIELGEDVMFVFTVGQGLFFSEVSSIPKVGSLVLSTIGTEFEIPGSIVGTYIFS